jgi:hypothetical protein
MISSTGLFYEALEAGSLTDCDDLILPFAAGGAAAGTAEPALR